MESAADLEYSEPNNNSDVIMQMQEKCRKNEKSSTVCKEKMWINI